MKSRESMNSRYPVRPHDQISSKIQRLRVNQKKMEFAPYSLVVSSISCVKYHESVSFIVEFQSIRERLKRSVSGLLTRCKTKLLMNKGARDSLFVSERKKLVFFSFLLVQNSSLQRTIILHILLSPVSYAIFHF